MKIQINTWHATAAGGGSARKMQHPELDENLTKSD
jgi:hypothetical protein